MLRLPVLLSGLLLLPVANTLWWRSTIGTVVEHREKAQTTCTLTLHNDDGQFSFIWDRALPTRVIVQRKGWSFPAGVTTVTMQIGSVSFDGSNGTSGIPALTRTSAVMFVADQPVTGPLTTADRITVQTPKAQFSMNLPPVKMAALMTAVQNCRTAISR